MLKYIGKQGEASCFFDGNSCNIVRNLNSWRKSALQQTKFSNNVTRFQIEILQECGRNRLMSQTEVWMVETRDTLVETITKYSKKQFDKFSMCTFCWFFPGILVF